MSDLLQYLIGFIDEIYTCQEIKQNNSCNERKNNQKILQICFCINFMIQINEINFYKSILHAR